MLSFSGSFLKPKLTKALSSLQSVKAISVAVLDGVEYLVVCRSIHSRTQQTVTEDMRGALLEIYQIDELLDQLQLVFVCRAANEQLPFLAN